MKKIILASGSPRRKELLAQIGLDFEVIVSDAEEVMTSTHPGEVVKELSGCKAMAVALTLNEDQKDAVVIGADTVVAQDDRILGKPKDEEDAFQMLHILQGQTHQVYTGVTLINGEKKVSFYEKSDVSVYPMTDDEIWEYIHTGEPMDKAGAYGIQGYFAKYIREVQGEYTTIVGLPLGRLWHELTKFMR